MQTYSQKAPLSTTTIPREQHAALFAIINKARLLNGWTTRTAQELDPTIRTWAEAFSWHSIPTSAYPELYKRAFEVRANRMHGGNDVPQMDATLLVSQWVGSYGLQAQWRLKQIEERRSLPTNAESNCDDCLGTGFKMTESGGYRGMVKCTHGNQ
jgi:hypothetical protein